MDLHKLVSSEDPESKKRKRIESNLSNKEEIMFLRSLEIEKLIGIKIKEETSAVEVGEHFVSHLCFQNNNPSSWKLLKRCLSSHTVLPFHVLSLLSSKIIPHYHSQPEAFRLFLELLSTHPLHLHINDSMSTALRHKVIRSIDQTLSLSELYDVDNLDIPLVIAFCLFGISVGLIDCALDEWGLHNEHLFNPFPISCHRENDAASQHRNTLRRGNSFVALKILSEITQSEKVLHKLHLIKLNFPEKFVSLQERVKFYEASKINFPISQYGNELMEMFSSNIERVSESERRLNQHCLLPIQADVASSKPTSFSNWRSSCWISFDIHLENFMDKQLLTKPAINMLIETMRTLKIVNQATWQETFLAMWLAALRLVQRERDPLEGPFPHLESRLCILLSIVPLAIEKICENPMPANKYELLCSLQMLGQFSALLSPPASIVDAADSAASKAARFLFERQRFNSVNTGVGNMRHLIVEACMARNLIDTSIYISPGYLSISQCNAVPSQKSPWASFMEGHPLNDSLISVLVDTPASSVEEIEKVFDVAVGGSKAERHVAAKILCSASLRRGWNIQEHVVRHVVKLLSPPKPSNHSASVSHLFEFIEMLNVLLFGISSVDAIHMLSLHGVIPEVAASLMPLCETFGSLVPTSVSRLNICDDSSVYNVFSSAFLILLRLWKFYGAPTEQLLNEKCAFGNELSLEYILFVRNSRADSGGAVYLDFYPKLRSWYCQNKSCVASPLSELPCDDSLSDTADKVLTVMCSSGSVKESGWAPVLPAWDVMASIPYVLEAMLTACAHGRLSSRDLTTGLRDLIDILPAAIGSIISYFSAEITRGVWKPVSMNGVDWPSPAAIMSSLESEMVAVLATAGVNVSNLSSGSGTATVPLPLAALVSLAITFKLTAGNDFIHSVVGPALENCASAGPWPYVSTVGSLWVQKVRRWHNFILVSSARSVFRHHIDAVVQLLRSCFASFLGPDCGVNALLGSSITLFNGFPVLCPGFLYLRSYRMINVRYLNDAVVKLVAEYARKSAVVSSESCRLMNGNGSLSVAAVKVKEVAMLGSSLLCVSGGMNLVQELYRETVPAWLLASRDGKPDAVECVLEGYAMAYTVILSGTFVWGGDVRMGKRAKVFGGHMEFLARVLEGNLSVGCDAATWKAYVSCLLNLAVNVTPTWIKDVKGETLKKVAVGLTCWNQKSLALALLKRGGVTTMASAVDLIDLLHL